MSNLTYIFVHGLSGWGSLRGNWNRKNIQPGVWNIFPVYHGDHMMIHGGLTRKTDVKKFYVNLLSMIDAL